MSPRPPQPRCPSGGSAVARARRSRIERLAPELRRWRCMQENCGWAGLLAHLPAAQQALEPTAALPTTTAVRWAAQGRIWWRKRGGRRLGRKVLMVSAGGLLASLATAFVLHRPAPESVMVGTNVLLRGSHLEGERLPAAHPLVAVLPAQALEIEPKGYVEDGPSVLRVRRLCAWGLPGRNPYRGAVEQALQTATLSATVVTKIAASVRAGQRVDRVTIGNDGIHAQHSGRVFDPQRVAMTYGMTMCVDTRVNFKAGHTEQGDLYEAMDDDGRIYAVMVPDVCGNVSVVGQRVVKTAAPAPRAAGGVASDPRPWLQLPPEERLRELPRALRYADADPATGEGRNAPTSSPVSAPGSLLLSGLALGLALLLGRQRNRQRTDDRSGDRSGDRNGDGDHRRGP